MFRRHVIARFRLYYRLTKKFFLQTVLHANDSPHRIALGVGLGFFVGFTPTIGFQMIIVVFLAWLLRANKAVGVPLVWISNPVTFIPLYFPSYWLGCKMMGMEGTLSEFETLKDSLLADDLGLRDRAAQLWELGLDIMAPLWLGSMVVATIFGVATYLITLLWITQHRLHRQGIDVKTLAHTPATDTDDGVPSKRMFRRLYLASTSPRRAKLLTEAGYRYKQIPPRLDDSEVHLGGGIPPIQHVEALAYLKACSLVGIVSKGVIMSCDTMLVTADNKLMGKPTRPEQARQMLRKLFDRPHKAVTAVILIDAANPQRRMFFTDTTTVTIEKPSDEDIDEYIRSGEWQGKAGGYNLAELECKWNFTLDGDPTTVIGLPMVRLSKALTQFAPDIEASRKDGKHVISKSA